MNPISAESDFPRAAFQAMNRGKRSTYNLLVARVCGVDNVECRLGPLDVVVSWHF